MHTLRHPTIGSTSELTLYPGAVSFIVGIVSAQNRERTETVEAKVPLSSCSSAFCSLSASRVLGGGLAGCWLGVLPASHNGDMQLVGMLLGAYSQQRLFKSKLVRLSPAVLLQVAAHVASAFMLCSWWQVTYTGCIIDARWTYKNRNLQVVASEIWHVLLLTKLVPAPATSAAARTVTAMGCILPARVVHLTCAAS